MRLTRKESCAAKGRSLRYRLAAGIGCDGSRAGLDRVAMEHPGKEKGQGQCSRSDDHVGRGHLRISAGPHHGSPEANLQGKQADQAGRGGLERTGDAAVTKQS